MKTFKNEHKNFTLGVLSGGVLSWGFLSGVFLSGVYVRGGGFVQGGFCLRTRNKVQIYASSVKSPSAFQHVKRGGDTCWPRSAESSGKGCYRNLFPRSKSIHFHHLHHLEEGWGEKTSGRHARTESVCRVSSIQDGGYITAERYPLERRLHDKAGSSRCLLDYSSGSKIKDLFKIFLEGRALSGHMSTIRPLSISKVVHQDTLKPVIAFLRSLGIRLLIFLDDILIMADSPERAAEYTEIVIRVLESPGFVIKKKKSILKPTQTIPFLGFIVNSIKMLLLLPEGKLQK